MGILHKSISYKQNDEEIERRNSPYQILNEGRHKSCYTTNNPRSNFYERFRKIVLSVHSSFYNGLKGLFSYIFFWKPKNKAKAEPILPLVNPDPLLVQPLVISSLPDLDSSESDDEEIKHCVCVDIDVDVEVEVEVEVDSDSSHQWAEEICGTTLKQQRIRDDVIIISGEEEICPQVRWIKHYSSSHRILIVGDGDFSFSACLAVAFCQASNMIATSLDSKEFLEKNYRKVPSNIQKLRSRGCIVMHGIDATKMANNALLGHLTFDRIIFNFPFAGFFKDLSYKSQLRRHRRLVSLFMKNAKEMISKDGEIHISHKTNRFHSEWNLESMASSHKLKLIEAIKFHHRDYPGYNTKCGFGGDNNFNYNPSKTYKFGLRG
ncbi:hypothetical protein RD792_002580 [Penstemon davidsonii]|uniref:25S rRNA (uridine-N(3))-methyltransferase BMT5-like domain-containing protein n=1 Tax=Penstemon davidsonii TaxID=160366 RepID=A0ABR0DRU4_9LAMI|nr:hypothetical protein RD792_002580 [Penstemon davidsonii]